MCSTIDVASSSLRPCNWGPADLIDGFVLNDSVETCPRDATKTPGIKGAAQSVLLLFQQVDRALIAEKPPSWSPPAPTVASALVPGRLFSNH